ncbi:MAG TPA: PilZ domain-containing protein [Alphaproteobacteria bacterium]|nr:PilZ domain-containing protein [Alphaproteobacteria bacterium]
MTFAGDFDRGVERILDRREEVRYEGGVDGSFALSGQGRSGGVLVFACRINSISAKSIVLTAPAKGSVGEQIWVDVRGFGIVRGEIDHHLDEGFVLRVIGSGDFQRKLGAWVNLMRRRGGRVSSDKRAHMRAQPRDPRTMVRLPYGELVRGLVSNVSRSGAAISADCTVEPGDEVIVGLVPARVVRRLEVGFAVAFDEVLEAAVVDRLVTGFRDTPILDRDAG